MNISQHAKELQTQSIVFRGHADVYEMVQRGLNGEIDPIYNSWLPRLSEAGVDVVFLAVSGDSPAHRNGDMRYLHGAMKILDQVLLESERNPEVKIIRTKDDIPNKSDGGLNLLLTLEGGLPLEGELSLLRQFYRLGIRLLQPTHNLRNELADGGNEEGTGGRLSRFGVEVVKECNKLGIVIDLAHLTEPGFWHVLEISEKPVIVSHADSKAVHYHRRNLTDEQIKAIAKQGGTVGLLYYPNYLKDGAPTIEALLKHAEHVLELVGSKHLSVGHLGLDKELVDTFATITAGPYANYHKATQKYNGGVNEKLQYGLFIEGLLKMGLDDGSIRDILGGNYMRVLNEVL